MYSEVLRIKLPCGVVIYIDSKHVPELVQARAERDAALLRIQELKTVLGDTVDGVRAKRIQAESERDELRRKLEQAELEVARLREHDRDVQAYKQLNTAQRTDICDLQEKLTAAEQRTTDAERERDAMRPVVEAAEKWNEAYTNPHYHETAGKQRLALNSAVRKWLHDE